MINKYLHDRLNEHYKNCEQSVIELIKLSGIKIEDYNINTAQDSQKLIDDLNLRGYFIEEIVNKDNILKTTYILKYLNKIIAQRDIIIKIT